jgi:hypothetical protein
VHGIKALGLRLRQLQHARRHHAQARLLESTINFADQITADAVRLDDGKSALNWHDNLGYFDGISALRRTDKDREVYWSAHAQAIRPANRSACIAWKNPVLAET